MPWTETTRPHYERRCPRYASDLTDAEWALIEPLMPVVNRIGRPRETDLREVVNALLYMASSGGAWRLLPKDFPPFSTVQKYFYRWRDEGRLRAINNELVRISLVCDLHALEETQRLYFAEITKLLGGAYEIVTRNPVSNATLPMRLTVSVSDLNLIARRWLRVESNRLSR